MCAYHCNCYCLSFLSFQGSVTVTFEGGQLKWYVEKGFATNYPCVKNGGSGWLCMQENAHTDVSPNFFLTHVTSTFKRSTKRVCLERSCHQLPLFLAWCQWLAHCLRIHSYWSFPWFLFHSCDLDPWEVNLEGMSRNESTTKYPYSKVGDWQALYLRKSPCWSFLQSFDHTCDLDLWEKSTKMIHLEKYQHKPS